MKRTKFLKDYGDTLETKHFGNGHRARKIRKARLKQAKLRMYRDQDKFEK
jgi:hypothetical protein